MGPFVVTRENIRGIADELLRELLIRLIEAEARDRRINLSGIRAGGNQTAPDGGVDAWIEWEGGPAPGGWLPARSIAFQCKAEHMRPAAIRDEMRPGGEPRPLLTQLASAAGAYIIFTTDDPAGLKHAERTDAMREATSDVDEGDAIILRYYAADQIARWTSRHMGVTLWLLDRLGRGLTGWRPHGDWSASGSAEKPYIAGADDRLYVGGVPCNALEAINAVRERLREPGGAVRLIGISGLGKTRFAEALFDERVGSGALPPTMAIYADAGHELRVGVPVLAEQTAGEGVKAVIVADNCPGGLHAQAAEIVRRSSSVSLLTIDHELLEVPPDGTLVVQMNENSPEAIAGLLAQRCAWLSDSEISHLADFAGGNARVALKIAEGSRGGVNIASLNDAQMLERLFQVDRRQVGPDSRRCADAASLVYAFYADEADHEHVEHPVLARIAGLERHVFYEEVARLIEFGIAQRRGPQRAIMPPPIANMLAIAFIRRAEPAKLLKAFEGAPPRLFKSFARRLGNLHAVSEAVSLAKTLLTSGGLLGDPGTLKGELREAFINLAPAAPKAAVAAIRRSQAGPHRAKLLDVDREARRDFGGLLARIAHDQAMFPLAMEAMLPFLLLETERSKRYSVAEHFYQRFWPRLSFTLAGQDSRLAVIDRLLDDEDARVKLIGVEALDNMLATYFSSSMQIGFGARAVNREWRPAGTAGYQAWCAAAFDRLAITANEDGIAARRARQVVADNFRQQLSAGGNQSPIEAVRAVRGPRYWDAGWSAVCEALSFRRSSFSLELVPAVIELERELRPRTPDELFEAFVMGESWRHWHPSGRGHCSMRNVERLAQRLGTCAARKGVADGYMARAIGIRGPSSAYHFAEGVGAATTGRSAAWLRARDHFASLPTSERNPTVLAGLLAGAVRSDPRWVDEVLDAAALDPELMPSLVTLHLGVPVGHATMLRFTAALRDGSVSAPEFDSLMYGGVSKGIAADELAAFLRELFSAENGAGTALQILHMRLHGDREDKRPLHPQLLAVARELVVDPRAYDERHSRHDHVLESLASVVLSGECVEQTAREICRAYLARHRLEARGQDFGKLCRMLLKRFPGVVLDEVVAPNHPDDVVDPFFGNVLRDSDDADGGSEEMDGEAVLSWVTRDPAVRAVRLAEFVRYFVKDGQTGDLAWSPIALGLIEAAPDPISVLDALERRFWSGSGSGSFASRFVRRRPLIAAMTNHGDRRIRNWARQAAAKLEENIGVWDEHDRRDEPRFE